MGDQYLTLEGFQTMGPANTGQAEIKLKAVKWNTFGVSLHKLLSLAPGAKKDVPAFIEEALGAVVAKGQTTKELWTTVPNRDEIKQIADTLASGGKVDWTTVSPTLAAGVVKGFFQKLPTPLLTNELHDIWIGAAQDIFPAASEQVEFLAQVVNALPAANRETLRVLIRTFNAFYKSGSEENKKFIAPVWGPILLLRQSIHVFKSDVPDSSKLVHLLTKNYDAIFPETNKRSRPTGQAAPWLRKINKDRLEKLTTYANKADIVLTEVVKFGQENTIDVAEFQLNIQLMKHKLTSIVEAVNNESVPLHYVVETHHADKFYNYLSDFHDALIQGKATNSLVRSFKSTRLRASFERLALSCQYELVLFFQLVDELYGGSLRSQPAYKKKSDDFFNQFMKDPQGKDLWKRYCGEDNFIMAWPTFIQAYAMYISPSTISFQTELMLKRVLDNAETGFVTVFRFAEFLKGFGPLNESLTRVHDVASQPWFHGYMSNPEADKLLEACEVGTFLVRFSESDPGSCAINFKDPNGNITRIKVEPTPNGYAVREGTALREFPSISEMVVYYGAYLRSPFADRMMDYPWFYGDLTVQETQIFLEYEPIGTYLIRFSSQYGCFTCSYIREDGICHCRLQRLPDGQIEFDGRLHNSIAHFIEINARWLVYPYRNDNTVSSAQEEDEARRIAAVAEDEDEKIEYKDFFFGVPETVISEDDKLAELINKSTTEKLRSEEQKQLLHSLLAAGVEKADKLIKKAHKEVSGILARKSKKKTSGFFNSTKKTPVSLTAHSFIECNANTCKPVVLTFGATNNSKGTAKFSVDTPVDLHNRYFLSVNAPNGTIDKGKAVQFQIAVVLYKPICLKRLVTIRFELEEGEEIYHIPIQVGVSRAALKHDTPQDPFWTITKDEYQMDSRIGGGASASVFTASLYGATVAVKKWDLGKKDDPPRDFLAELDVYKQLRHENLVLFIGAMSETGTAVLVTEFLKNGSLDNFLQKNKDRKPFKLKLNMAIDAAKGMRYVHSHNKIHRDMKSLNLLVDEVFKVKVTDFGESREKDANMTQATGTYNWMAPEVLMSQNYTMKADVFSFGIILWELLMEQYPNRTMQEVQEGRVPDIPKQVWDQSEEFGHVILACCRLNPAKRPSYATIVRQLKTIRKIMEQKKLF